jgi:hypothetical protein
MIGDRVLRSLVSTSWDRVRSSAVSERLWHRKGRSERGEQVWERVFGTKRGRRGFVVTVLFDELQGKSRLLFATDIRRGDAAPRVPAYVKRQTQMFIDELEGRGN